MCNSRFRIHFPIQLYFGTGHITFQFEIVYSAWKHGCCAGDTKLAEPRNSCSAGISMCNLGSGAVFARPATTGRHVPIGSVAAAVVPAQDGKCAILQIVLVIRMAGKPQLQTIGCPGCVRLCIDKPNPCAGDEIESYSKLTGVQSAVVAGPVAVMYMELRNASRLPELQRNRHGVMKIAGWNANTAIPT